MTADRLRDVVDEGEALRFEAPLRTGGRLGVTDDRVLAIRTDAVETVPLENVKEVTIQSVDWFLVVLSVALAGVGLYGVFAVGDPLLGVVFVVAATVNLLLTYRKRGRISLRLHTGGSPVVAHVDDIDEVETALQRAIQTAEARTED